MKHNRDHGTHSKAGVNPLSGCIPALLQMPVFFALFSFFPTAFMLRQKSLCGLKTSPLTMMLWLSYLSLFLLWKSRELVPILASVTMLIYMLMTTGQMQQTKQEGMPDTWGSWCTSLLLWCCSSSIIMPAAWACITLYPTSLPYLLCWQSSIGLSMKRIHAKIQENKQNRVRKVFQRKMRDDGTGRSSTHVKNKKK